MNKGREIRIFRAHSVVSSLMHLVYDRLRFRRLGSGRKKREELRGSWFRGSNQENEQIVLIGQD